MRELSLFTGAGGGLLATHHLLGWTTVGYVEINDYCQRVIAQRIRDGYLSGAPIFGDIRAFISEGYAASYTGMVDVVTGGFPCQPFSIAGKQLSHSDPRNMWPATLQVLRITKPKYALLENVPGLLGSGYFSEIIGDLAKAGLVGQWHRIPASVFVDQKCGDRLWIVAQAMCEGFQGIHKTQRGINSESTKSIVSRLIRRATPRVYRRGDGVANRVERTRAIGNGQVPIVAATAWRILSGERQ
jgi:DNA (cytosine-5)-methyltransferase 1